MVDEEKVVNLVKKFVDVLKEEIVHKIYDAIELPDILAEAFTEVIIQDFNKFKELCEEYGYEDDECETFLWWLLLENALVFDINVGLDEELARKIIRECIEDKYCWVASKGIVKVV